MCERERERDKGERDRREREEGDMRYERVKIRGRENVFEWKVKGYFGILDNLSLGQKVVPWFSEGHESELLSGPLLPILSSCPVP